MKHRTQADGASIRRSKKDRDNPYAQIRRASIEDKRLSWEATGVLCYLLAKPDDWVIQVKDLISSSPCGRDKVYRILLELEHFGYLEKIQLQDEDGKFDGIRYYISEEPLPEKPNTEKPDTVCPNTEKPDHTNKEVPPNNQLTNNKTAKKESHDADASMDTPPLFSDDSQENDNSIPEKPLTEQQEMFRNLCDAVGWDPKTLPKASQGKVAQAGKKLREAGYTPRDIGRFMKEVWFQDWRWEKHGNRPTLTQLREEIGKIYSVTPVEYMPTNTHRKSNSRVSKSMAAVDRVFARLEEESNGVSNQAYSEKII